MRPSLYVSAAEWERWERERAEAITSRDEQRRRQKQHPAVVSRAVIEARLTDALACNALLQEECELLAAQHLLALLRHREDVVRRLRAHNPIRTEASNQ